MTLTLPHSPASPVCPAADADPLGAQLESLLGDLLLSHDRLLALAGTHRAAVSRADAHAVGACVDEQRTVVRRIQELEQARRHLVASVATNDKRTSPSTPRMTLPRGPALPAAPAPPARAPTLSAIAERLAEPARGRVLALASRLRELVTQVRREHGAIRAATESLLGHMEGLVAQVGRRLSHTGTYGRRGSIHVGPQVVSGFDLTH